MILINMFTSALSLLSGVLVMCSCSTKKRVSLVANQSRGRGRGDGRAEVADTEVAEADVTGKYNGITTWPLH